MRPRALDVCPICELPRFVHGWRIFRGRTSGLPFREPFAGSPSRIRVLRPRPSLDPRLRLDVETENDEGLPPTRT
jgi:hypothetical protein